jgi:DNA helicase-2/ATP-dependent DNA helicase PcrA
MNPLQYAFLQVVTSVQPDLFLVGDPNQAIYGFNGADKTLFDTLPKMNGSAHVVSLPSNYRCTPEIVRMAVNTLATDGQIADAESRRSIGQPVLLQRCSTETDETAFITKSVLRAKSGRSWNDIAVLVRVNAVADQVREELSKVGVPIRSSRRGGAWARAVAAATDLTGRESLSAWAADILDTGEYDPEDVDFIVATFVRQFLDENRQGTVDGRTFSSWLATSADVSESDGVEVLTFHAAKGREWSYVIVASAEKGMLPHRGARSSMARSEEARLAYVALTRAADELVVSWTDSRNGKPSGPSPFLPSVSTEIQTFDPPPAELRRRARASRIGNPIQNAIEDWRKDTARLARVEPHAVLSTRCIRMMVREVPTTIEDIARMSDPVFARRHGAELLEIITEAAAH